MFHCLELTSGKGNLISFFQACSMNDQTQFTCLGFGLSFAIITQTCKLILNVYFSCEFCLLVFCFYLGFPMAPFYSEVVVCSWSPWASLHLRVSFQWRPKRTLKLGRSWDYNCHKLGLSSIRSKIKKSVVHPQTIHSDEAMTVTFVCCGLACICND